MNNYIIHEDLDEPNLSFIMCTKYRTKDCFSKKDCYEFPGVCAFSIRKDRLNEVLINPSKFISSNLQSNNEHYQFLAYILLKDKLII